MNEQNQAPEFPAIPPQLIEALDQIFPDKLSRNPESFFSGGRLVGQQDVIDRLKLELKRQSGRLR